MRKLLLCCAAVSRLSAQIIDVSEYGWLNQYSMNNYLYGYIGDEACLPTASTNGLTYLQNVNPEVFGPYLTGTTSYSNWEQADITLIGLMSTTPVSGTYNGPFVYGLETYVQVQTGFPQVQFSGVYPNGYPISPTISTGYPSFQNISTAIAAGSATLILMTYTNGNGSHEVVVNGIEWDPYSNTGTLYFVDSLDSSENYSSSSPAAVLGPVKQTTGTLSLDKKGRLLLEYYQYEGNLSPYDSSDYTNEKAIITGLLSVGGAEFTPFAQLIPDGNAHSIAQGFDAADHTTAPMFSVLAVLNTAADPSSIFNQIDPAKFNSILFTEQAISEQVLSKISNNLLQYRQLCLESCCQSTLTGWCAPLATELKQRGVSGGSYKNTLLGTVAGLDYFFNKDFLIGAGLSYAHGDVRWTSGLAKANINNYGTFLYGAWLGDPLWIDLCASYAYNRIDARNTVFGRSTFLYIPSIHREMTQRINSNVVSGHLGLIYDLFYKRTWCGQLDLWPFFNLDAICAYQPNYYQQGGGALDLTIMNKWASMIRPEAGLGCSYYRTVQGDIDAFVHASLSYAYESHVGSSGTNAYFSVAGADNFFTVRGSVPHNHLVCPFVQAGFRTPCNRLNISINYRGAFGSELIANQLSAELNTRF